MKPTSGRPNTLPQLRHRAHGQSVVEFAIVVPVMLLLLIAIADMGRLYGSVVAIESAAREAADYGAFDSSYWDGAHLNYIDTTNEMQRRACVAVAGSHLQDYQTTDPVNHTTCLNPSFTCTLERNGAATECAVSAGFTNGIDCADPTTDPACTVHVRLDYQFKPILAIPPLPDSIQITRHSYFRVSNLQPPPGP